VYCFENRGEEVGVTLHHPHGQVYAFPFVPPRTSRLLARAHAHRASTGRNLFDDLVASELAEFAVHLQVLPVGRGPGEVKFVAGTESAAGVWSNDVLPEVAAGRLRRE